MGGTFDPIHIAHLIVGEYAIDEFGLDKIIFIPTGNPPHKENYTDAKLRFEMVKLAIEANENFILSDIETKKDGYSYSVETVSALNDSFDGKFYFIIGSDILFQLKTWKEIGILSKEVEFICALRPEFNLNKVFDMEMDYLRREFETKVNIIKPPLCDLSSTYIRNRILNEKSVKYLLPDKVINYINEHNLYRG